MTAYTATSLDRLMQCMGSAQLEKQIEPRTVPSSTTKEEGEAAHWLAKTVFEGKHSLEEMTDRKAQNGFYITPEMAQLVGRYLDVILPQGGFVDVITHVMLSDDKVINGRADHIALVGNTLHINAFHYGYKLVRPDNNWAMIFHAASFIRDNDLTPDEIVFTVHQPRAYRPRVIPSTITLTFDQLNAKWAEVTHKLSRDSGTCTTGPACSTCKVNYGCTAFTVAQMNALDVSEKTIPDDIDNIELSGMLDELERAQEIIKTRIKTLSELTMHRLSEGQAIKNRMLEEKPGAMRWNEGLDADVLKALIGHDVAKPAVITPTQARDKYKIPEAILQTVTNRPAGKPQLVRVDANDAAAQMFNKLKS